MRIFVYGTLKRGGRLHPAIKDSIFSVTEGTTSGQLLNVGSFPGMITGDRKIKGELFEVDPEVLPTLDYIEGYQGPGKHNLYEREVVSVETENGNVEAYCYKWGGGHGYPTVYEDEWDLKKWASRNSI